MAPTGYGPCANHRLDNFWGKQKQWWRSPQDAMSQMKAYTIRRSENENMSIAATVIISIL
jgi:hypothetical protein